VDGRQKIKTSIDLAMTAVLPVLMCYSIVGETAHEIIGVTMFCLFLAHNSANTAWFGTLFKGKYTLRRGFGTAVNALVLLCMLGQVYSCTVISKHLFTFFDVSGAVTARLIHLRCAYWGAIWISIHLGIHLSGLLSRFNLNNGRKNTISHIVLGAIAIMGIYAFFKLGFLIYLFGKSQFVFIDTTASPVLTTLEYLSVMILFAEIGYCLDRVAGIFDRNLSTRRG
jgi:hypothetical protein